MKSEQITLAHGSGGKKTEELFKKYILPAFHNPHLTTAHDGAILSVQQQRIAFSSDSFVVNPIFFPGGNIGDLAVNGTVNDLAMCGAIPVYLSCGLIIEEGLSIEHFQIILKSMSEAAKKAGVQIVTGDTKVVEHGKVDKLFINTTGIGEMMEGIQILPRNARPGDIVIINGSIADHGIAVMTKREGIDMRSSVRSDSASLNRLVHDILVHCPDVRVLRDPTRGGLAMTLNEIASASGVGIEIKEDAIPISDIVASTAGLLGLDPLYIANEGKVVIIVPEDQGSQVLAVAKQHEEGKNACVIGQITQENSGCVSLLTKLGTRRIVDAPVGERMPRIC